MLNNLHLMLNNKYYEGMTYNDKKGVVNSNIESKNDWLINSSKFYNDSDRHSIDLGESYKDYTLKRLYMRCSYPGLTLGLSYMHVRAKTNSEDGNDNMIDNGFGFDYVTGQPYIPGSSIKGILRSAFSNGIAEQLLYSDPKIKVKLEYEPQIINSLEKEIFEDAGVIFFDAYIYTSNNDNHIIGLDNIAPHKESKTKSPDIHTILRVLPDVVFEFSFYIKNGENVINCDEKINLFKNILKYNGAGAKTNVGYGVLIPLENAPITNEGYKIYRETQHDNENPPQNFVNDYALNRQQQPRENQYARQSNQNNSFASNKNNAQRSYVHRERANVNKSNIEKQIPIGQEYLAKITGIEKYGVFVSIIDDSEFRECGGLVHCNNIKAITNIEALGIGMKLRVLSIQQYKKGKNNFKLLEVLGD